MIRPNYENIATLGKLEINLKELGEFLVKAKRSCYAGNGKKEIMPDGSKRLIFQEDDFWYEDNYDGFYRASGRELVKWKREDGQRIWQMVYCGGMHLMHWENKRYAKKVFNFLKKALMEVTSDKPFRGPEHYRFWGEGTENYGQFMDNEFSYYTRTEGNIIEFMGNEGIESKKYRSTRIYLFKKNYMGGLILPEF